MKSKQNIIAFVASLAFIALPLGGLYAQTTGATTNNVPTGATTNNTTQTTTGTTQTTVPPTAGTSINRTTTLRNPLAGVNSLAELFTKLANLFVSIMYAVIAFFLLLSGFKFIKAQGNEEELKTAKKTFYYTIIGAIIIVGAQTIIAVVDTVIKDLQK